MHGKLKTKRFIHSEEDWTLYRQIGALIKRKSNVPHIHGNSEWSSCKVIYEEGFPI
jgi:hypothetical protein